MREFNVLTVNDVIDARKRKFLAKYSVSENSLCQVFARMGNLRSVLTVLSICTMLFVICYLVKFFFYSLSVTTRLVKIKLYILLFYRKNTLRHVILNTLLINTLERMV